MRRFDEWSVLALLRFALASIVAVNHLAETIPLGALAVVPYFGAFQAILGFLLVSGYSVGRSFFAKPEGFLQRRLWRVYPVYLASIAITLAVRPPPLTLQLGIELLLNAAFLNQVLTLGSLVGPAWSLALEFWLYALMRWFARQSDARLRLLAYLAFVADAAYTCARSLLHWPYYAGLGFGISLVLLAYPWICGLRLARQPPSDKRPLMDVAFFFAAHIALGSLIQAGHRLKTGGDALMWHDDLWHAGAQAATLFVVWSTFRFLVIRSDLPGASPGRSRVMTALGELSFPLYLIHLPVFAWLAGRGATNPWWMLATAGAMAMALDAVSRRLARLAQDGWVSRRRALKSRLQ